MKFGIVALNLAVIAAIALYLHSSMSKSGTNVNLDRHVEFFAFKEKYGKVYSSENELAYRKRIFLETLKSIELHNADKSQTYTLGINQFSDMTFEELKAKYLVDFSNFQGHSKCEKQKSWAHLDQGEDPKSEIDWQKEGKVQSVKNQQDCGSCWAFSAIGALESAYAIYKKGSLPNLSEQELVDCSKPYGNSGCLGGLMNLAFDYILDKKINTEKDYPYIGVDQKCNANLSGKGTFELKGCVQAKNNVEGLVAGLRKQPVSIAFTVQEDFFKYAEGIYNPKKCPGYPNHGVLAVGFKLNEKIPYFKMKNSWGEEWGDKGYFKIATGTKKGTCDLAGSGWNYYPTV